MGWWRVGEGWRVGAAEQTKLEGWGGFGKARVDTAEYAGLEGWRARPRRAPGAGPGRAGQGSVRIRQIPKRGLASMAPKLQPSSPPSRALQLRPSTPPSLFADLSELASHLQGSEFGV